jgi:hypothetical protein
MPQPKIKNSKSQPNQESLVVGRREKVAGFTHELMQAEDGEGRICSKPELAKKSKKSKKKYKPTQSTKLATDPTLHGPTSKLFLLGGNFCQRFSMKT